MSTAKLKKIDRPHLADLAAERISEWIASSRLKPGAKLPSEQSLMEALGLGRSVIREALAKLKAVGMVETYQGRGAYVADLPFELLRNRVRRFNGPPDSATDALDQIWELREIFEVGIVELAAKRRTQEDLAQLDEALIAMDRAIAAGRRGVTEDAMFHYCLTRAAQNPLLLDLIEDISTLIESSRRDSLLRSGRPESSNIEHARILEAIRRRDVRAAKRAMRQHLINGKRLHEPQLSESIDEAP